MPPDQPAPLLRRFLRRTRRGRRLQACLLASVLLHLLAVAVYQRWAAEPVRRAFRPVRYAQAPALLRPSPFRPVEPTLPPVAPVPVRPAAPLPPALAPFHEDDARSPSVDLSTSVDFGAEPANPRGKGPARPSDVLPTLEQLRADAAQALRADREGYARIWLPDADTTDAASARRARARQIVLAAVEAMGGRDALLQVRDLSYEGRFHQAFGPRSRYAQWLPGGARLLYDGDRAVVDVHGEQVEVRGAGVAAIRRRAERWDFLSRYLGDGVDLEYLGTARRRTPRRLGLDQTLEQPTVHVIRINDRRYGGLVFHACFEAVSGLLQREDYPCRSGPGCVPDPLFERQAMSALFFGAYARVQDALLWTRVNAYSYKDGIFIGPPAPVSYDVIDPAMFSPSRPDTAVVEPRCCETDGTVWLFVGLPGLARPESVLPGASDTLSTPQRLALRDRVRRAVHQELRRQGVFARIEVADGADPARVPVGDYLLRVTLYDVLIVPPRRSPPIYQASLHLGGQGRQVMQDGPPALFYLLDGGHPVPNDPACVDYQFRVYSVDEGSIYTDAPHLRRLARRTVDKVASAVQQTQALPEGPYRFMADLTYCREP